MTHLVITSANIGEDYENRKEQYVESINQVLKFKSLFDTYSVLECTSKHEEYLEAYNLYYSNFSNTYIEKGLNELQHLKAHIKEIGLNNNDIIIKLTGRYLLENDYFLTHARALFSKGLTNSIFKLDNDVYEGLGYHTFLYAIKVDTFMKMFESFSYTNDNTTPIEWGVKKFLHGKPNTHLVDKLGILARQGTFSKNIFRS